MALFPDFSEQNNLKFQKKTPQASGPDLDHGYVKDRPPGGAEVQFGEIIGWMKHLDLSKIDPPKPPLFASVLRVS